MMGPVLKKAAGVCAIFGGKKMSRAKLALRLVLESW
jgi:hypothetical protein